MCQEETNGHPGIPKTRQRGEYSGAVLQGFPFRTAKVPLWQYAEAGHRMLIVLSV